MNPFDRDEFDAEFDELSREIDEILEKIKEYEASKQESLEPDKRAIVITEEPDFTMYTTTNTPQGLLIYFSDTNKLYLYTNELELIEVRTESDLEI